MTTADHPPVTDDARAEADRRWPPLNADDEMLTYPRAAIRDHARNAFIIGAQWAAGRAETTTATTEDVQTGTFEAILAAHREEYDSDCGMYFGCSCGWDNDDIGSNEGYVEHVADLLATARTRPTRGQIIDALVMSPLSDTAGTDMRPFEQTADAVLALLADQPDPAETTTAECPECGDNYCRCGIDWTSPAETTTATTEDMTTRLAAAEAELDRLCDGGRFIMSIPAREGYDSDLLIQAALTDLRGLLARPTPSRKELMRAAGLYGKQADAVLALLKGGTDE